MLLGGSDVAFRNIAFLAYEIFAVKCSRSYERI